MPALNPPPPHTPPLALTSQAKGTLLTVDFTTLSEYMFYLKLCTEAVASAGPSALVLLAAAVSDFYIPEGEMTEHKIQSRHGNLELVMKPVPKMIGMVTREWCPAAFTVSFKLETDQALLVPKVRGAMVSQLSQVAPHTAGLCHICRLCRQPLTLPRPPTRTPTLPRPRCPSHPRPRPCTRRCTCLHPRRRKRRSKATATAWWWPTDWTHAQTSCRWWKPRETGATLPGQRALLASKECW